MPKKLLLIAGDPWTLSRFRLEFMEALVKQGLQVQAAAPFTNHFLDVQKTLQEKGIILHPLPLKNTGLNPFYDLCTLWHMGILIWNVRPSLLFLYTLKPVLYGSLVGRLLGVRSIFSMITGLGYVFTEQTPLIKKIVSTLYKWALRFNQKVFFQNPDDRDLFITEKLIPSQKDVIINGSGVNLKDYEFSPLSPTRNPKFLFVGRLLKKKGILEYIQAAKYLKERYPETSYKIVGDVHPNPSSLSLPEILDLSQKYGLQYLGKQDDVRPTLKASTVFVLPSYREGTPRAVLEALAIGRPVITTDVPGCRETVLEGKNGFLVPVRNSTTLRDAMEQFILYPDLAPRMGAESRLLAQAKYDVHQVNHILLKEMGLLL